MKKLIVVILALGSLSSFAADSYTCKVTGEFYPLHAVVTNNGEIEFDILAGKNESLEYAYFVRAYLINKN